ncbi:MAG TPA: tripartite tricarboxylate transporter TctB family protein [Burkholderiales bacterium]
MSIRNPKDFWAGLIYIALGLGAMYIAQDYEMGTALRMGPGYFPTLLGGLLALIGLVSLVRSFYSDGEPIGALAVKATLLVCGGTVLFALLLRGAGLVISIIALVLVGSIASVRFRWGTAGLLAIGLAVFCVFVFVRGLGVPMPVLGSWFGG